MLYAVQTKHCGYKRRQPEQELLHRVLLAHLETFVRQVRTDAYALPGYVEKELWDYLKCGVLFRLEMEVCAHCGGPMRMVAALTDAVSVKKYLDGVGLCSTIPQIKPARPPPQEEFGYYDEA